MEGYLNLTSGWLGASTMMSAASGKMMAGLKMALCVSKWRPLSMMCGEKITMKNNVILPSSRSIPKWNIEF